ncbi:hypothetical protein BC629DRAFT_923448 [Irpex lacteus]|nr:hypothetical protein BC629DRAFT_923448 [Irpex lacteus]
MFMRASFRNAARNVAQRLKRDFSRQYRDEALPATSHTHALFKSLIQLPGHSQLRLVKLMPGKDTTKILQLISTDSGVADVPKVWEDILTASDFPTFIATLRACHERLQDGTSDTATPDSRQSQVPTLLVLHALLNRATTLEQLLAVLALVHDHLSVASQPLKPILVISAVARASELGLVAMLRPLIDSLLHMESASKTHYRLMLRALSLAPRSVETGALTVELVTAMSSKKYSLRKKKVYDALLRPTFLTPQVAESVEDKLSAERIKPSPHHLRSLLRLFSTRGFRRRALRYVKLLDSSPTPSLPGPTGSRLSHPRIHTRWSLAYVAAFQDTTAAQRYIQRMTAAKSFSSEASAESAESSGISVDAHTHQHSAAQSLTAEWLSVLKVAARDSKLTARALYLVFRKGRLRYTQTLSAYEIVIRGLLRKRGFGPAVTLWHELRDGGWSLGRTTLGIGVRALTSANQGHEAFTLLEDIHARYQARTSTATSVKIKPKAVNVEAINQFMTALRHRGRPDTVFALWDAMDVLYKLSPDVYTLNIMLGTARWARKYDQSLKGAFRSALAELGLSRSRHAIPEAEAGASPEEIREQVTSYIRDTLDPDKPPKVVGQWGFEPASTAALRIAVQVFLGNWPHLRTLRPPVRTTRRRPNDPATSPLLDLFHTLSESSDLDDHPTPLLHLLPEDTPPYPYPYIYPTDLTFRAFFDLLACESLHTEIPIALAWMRSLGVRPSKTTLATALVHYTEVGMDAPLIERFKGGPTRSPYAVLMGWMRAWVGEESMPTRSEMSDEMARLAFYRHSRYDDKRGFVVVDSDGRPMKRGLRWAHARVQ